MEVDVSELHPSLTMLGGDEVASIGQSGNRNNLVFGGGWAHQDGMGGNHDDEIGGS